MYEGGSLSPTKLQGKYTAALSRIGGAPISEDAKRHTPIFQRGAAPNEKEAVRDAANALSALWKVKRGKR
jgi:hypothetical protein